MEGFAEIISDSGAKRSYFRLSQNQLIQLNSEKSASISQWDLSQIEAVSLDETKTKLILNIRNSGQLVLRPEGNAAAWLDALQRVSSEAPFHLNVCHSYVVWENFVYWVKADPKLQFLKYFDYKGKLSQSFTRQQLYNSASYIANRMLKDWGVKKGDRVILAYPPGLQFYAAFMGCLKAGIIAVPVYPPNPARLDLDLERLTKIISISEAKLVLTNNEYEASRKLLILKSILTRSKWPENVPWKVTDAESIPDHKVSDVNEFKVQKDDIAFLQFTSGSTGDPKGVIVTNMNLVHNFENIAAAATRNGTPAHKIVVASWLPMYHDMGLIGTFLFPTVCGARINMMSPFSFIANPSLWIYLMSREQCTWTVYPNFALDLTVRKWKEIPGERPDLSRMDNFLNGSEPIKASSLRNFAKKFTPYGLSSNVFFPSFGMAEFTLIVSSVMDRKDNGVRTVVDSKGVERVSLGCPLRDVVLKVVDPESCRELKEGEVGELWLDGPSKALGYWGRKELTREIFEAQLENDPSQRRYLRTGDLCFVQNGELYFAGRVKDIIIVAGRNYYPQDLEQSMEETSPHVRPGCTAAFSLEVESGEAAGLVAEVEIKDKKAIPNLGIFYTELLSQLQQRVQLDHGVPVRLVALIASRSIPKTTSGKIQRSLTKTRLLAGKLPVFAAREFGEDGQSIPSKLVPVKKRVSPFVRYRWVLTLLSLAAGCGVLRGRFPNQASFRVVVSLLLLSAAGVYYSIHPGRK